MVQAGRPDDGTDPGGFNNVEFFVPLFPEKRWPVVERPNGERKVRTRHEIITDMSAELSRKLPGIEWAFSQYIRDNVMEAISGVKGDNSVKIYGPDLNKLEEYAEKVKNELAGIRGLYDLGIYRIMGQSNLEFAVDPDKCKRWGVQVADVNNVINSAVHGAPFTQMIEGEKTFDVTLRWPMFRRQDQSSILEIPVDIVNNSLSPGISPEHATNLDHRTAIRAVTFGNIEPGSSDRQQHDCPGHDVPAALAAARPRVSRRRGRPAQSRSLRQLFQARRLDDHARARQALYRG